MMKRNVIGDWWESHKTSDYYLDVGEVNMKMDLPEDRVVWTGLIFLRIGTSGGLS
jgi:hypothetical protein